MAQTEDRSAYEHSALGSASTLTRKRFSHRYTQSTPTTLSAYSLPLPSPTLTLSSRSTIPRAQTPEIDSEFDIPTPKPKLSPSATSRIPIRIRTPGLREIVTRPRSYSHSTITQSSADRSIKTGTADFLTRKHSSAAKKSLPRSRATLALSLESPSGTTTQIGLSRNLDLNRWYPNQKVHRGSGASGAASGLNGIGMSCASSSLQHHGYSDEYPYAKATSLPAQPARLPYLTYSPVDSTLSLPLPSQAMTTRNPTDRSAKPTIPTHLSTPTHAKLRLASASPSEKILRSALVRDEQHFTDPTLPSSRNHHRRHSSAAQPLPHIAPLKPHEQVLRARLERVLVSADDSEKTRNQRGRARAGSDTSLLGWLWSKDEEYEQDSDDEVFELPLPSTAPPHIQAFSESQAPTKSSLRTSPCLRAHTHTQQSSFSDFGFQSHSPRPRHAFSLTTVPSVGELAMADISDTSKSSAVKMPTPPPTPPPRSRSGSRTGFLSKASPSRRAPSINESPGQGKKHSITTPGSLPRSPGADYTRSSRARSRTQPPEPTSASRNGSPHTDVALRRSSPSSFPSINSNLQQRPTLTSSSSPRTPRTQYSPSSFPTSASLTLLPSSPMDTFKSSSSSAPPSPSATKGTRQNDSSISASRFNAQTASKQCRQIDGYVSFAAVAGLEEPGVQDATDENDASGHRGNAGWVGRLFGR
ncbi:hypothetical protein BT96DRAFT_923019 [Gymnopus androsaceus JB14]|uniref:Uncharacterized protein n=1 Tax=Gymnopus androsaceus JB14 TaxID=1447944 RepID=A0A6A4HD29_9AGAR|nr:hypothetical protein BT96DRAFT_923019 [Gymnopus androsaceus JB14]